MINVSVFQKKTQQPLMSVYLQKQLKNIFHKMWYSWLICDLGHAIFNNQSDPDIPLSIQLSADVPQMQRMAEIQDSL